jgi:hypothetical protein
VHLRVGMHLVSASGPASVIVLRAPAGDIDVRCGGIAMVAADNVSPSGAPAAANGSGLVLGKRYALESLDLECLCTKAGPGELTANGELLVVKEAKPLPPSD